MENGRRRRRRPFVSPGQVTIPSARRASRPQPAPAPSAFTLIFALIDLALILVLAATLNGSPGLAKAGGIAVFAFAAVGAYVFAGSLSVATGGKPFPLGRPVIT